MLKIKSILEKDLTILDYLKKRNLLEQYKKSKQKILSGNYKELNLREPKQEGVWYFRINKQFRAYAILRDENIFVVYKIDNHQN